MLDKDKVVAQLKHLVKYYYQASHEFFDDTSGELEERVQTFYQSLEKNENSLAEYEQMIDFLVTIHANLKQRVDALAYLTDRMRNVIHAV